MADSVIRVGEVMTNEQYFGILRMILEIVKGKETAKEVEEALERLLPDKNE